MSKTQYTREEVIDHLIQNGYKISNLKVSDNYEVYSKDGSLPVRLYKLVMVYDKAQLKDILPKDLQLLR